MKFTLSPNQEINLANKGLIYQNGKPVFNAETSQELTNTIQKALNKKYAKRKTIFEGNKTFADVICEGIIFAIGTATALLIATSIIIIFTNLIN